MFKFRSMLIPAALITVCVGHALAAPRVRAIGGASATGGGVPLPYSTTDSAGNQWFIYPGGWVQQRGNIPVYNQAGTIAINNNGVQQNANQARLDDRSGEIILENLNCGIPGITVTRRILIDTHDGFARFIDVLHNGSPQEQSLSVQIQTNMNYGVTSAEFVNEPAGKQRQIGWTAATPAGRAVAELFAGKGAKNVPTINWQQNSNVVSAQIQLTIPAGKDAALMHVHLVANSTDAGSQALLAMKESQLLANVPVNIRRAIVNFNVGGGYVGDREILRGDSLDVVELRAGVAQNANDPNASSSGDQLKGTIKDSKFKLNTFYGQVELNAGKIVGIINVGQFRPRQLLVSSDGEVFGGRLEQDSIALELSSGQTTQIPLAQISRIGWRKGPGELDDPTTQPDRPMVLLRSGDRFAVALPDQPIEVATRYGVLKVSPSSIASIAFASEDVGVHQIFLTDGSHFAGLVSGEQFQFKMTGGAGGQTVTIPASSLARLQLVGGDIDPDDSAAKLQLSNDDLLVGALVGQLKVDTAFDTIAVNAAEIRSLSRSKVAGANTDVQLELWDQSHLSGQLEEQELSCALASGLAIRVPLMMVDQYAQPLPQPSAAIIERIKQLVGELGADDWKQRENAESQIISMGSAAISVIKPMRSGASPEAQQRIDSIVRQLDVRKTKDRATTVGAPTSDD